MYKKAKTDDKIPPGVFSNINIQKFIYELYSEVRLLGNEPKIDTLKMNIRSAGYIASQGQRSPMANSKNYD